MIFFLILSVFVVTIVILIYVLGTCLLFTRLEEPPGPITSIQSSPAKGVKGAAPEEEKLPKIAVLIAARNEEENLNRCIRALEQLHYPQELLTVWIGNDNSSDNTHELAQRLCGEKANYAVLDIKEGRGKLKGKANVLAQLAGAAADSADYFFITDADVAVVPDWIMNMLPYFTSGMAMVNGTTLVEGKDWMGRMQRYDWLLSFGLVRAWSLMPGIGQTVTAMGNNLAICKHAYRAIGGYEGFPFSVTEDFELHRQFCAVGYKTRFATSAGTKAFTFPVEKFTDLLHQRKRWMKGAMKLPLPLLMVLVCQALFFPSVLVLLYYLPMWGVLLLLAKLFFQLMLARQMSSRLTEPPASPFLGYELYLSVLNASLLIFYCLPVKIQWKGRKY